MTAIWIAVVGAMLMFFNMATTLPELERQKIEVAADVAATNFFAYRKAAMDYVAANPSYSGTIPDSSLVFLPGYIRDTRWSNVVNGNTLYVFNNGASTIQIRNSIYEKGGRSMLIGKKSPAGNLINVSGYDTGVTLPAIIPVNAETIVGE